GIRTGETGKDALGRYYRERQPTMKKLIATPARGLAAWGFAGSAAAADAPASAPEAAASSAMAATPAAAPATAMASTAAPAAAASAPATAASAPVANKGDTAWMLVSTVLVIMMSIPGLA